MRSPRSRIEHLEAQAGAGPVREVVVYVPVFGADDWAAQGQSAVQVQEYTAPSGKRTGTRLEVVRVFAGPGPGEGQAFSWPRGGYWQYRITGGDGQAPSHS